jgi:hypothetical protein
VRSSWGSAALHPRLYAVARYRGLNLDSGKLSNTSTTQNEFWIGLQSKNPAKRHLIWHPKIGVAS